jgi:hypothetical protein
VYIISAIASCFILLVQAALRAWSLALEKTGNRIAAKMAIMAITTSSSINVNPRLRIPFHLLSSLIFIDVEFLSLSDNLYT